MLSAFAVVALSLVSAGGTPASADGPFEVTVLDTAGTPDHTSMALNDQGSPSIAYRDADSGDLKLVTCSFYECDSFSRTITTIDSTNDVGAYASMEMSPSTGFPVISYYDATTQDLMLATCDDLTCTNPQITAVVTNGLVGTHSDLTLGSSGYPVISYLDATTGALMLLTCADAECVLNNSISVIDGAGGRHTSVAVDPNRGVPWISYASMDVPATLKVATCGDSVCESGPQVSTVDGSRSVDVVSTSLVLSAGGEFPVIGYATTSEVLLASCFDATCSLPTLIVVEPGGGDDTSLTYNGSGFPVMTYYDATESDLVLVVCRSATCGTASQPFFTRTVVEGFGGVGRSGSVLLDRNGDLTVSYEATGISSDAELRLAYMPDTSWMYATVYAGAAATSPPTPDVPDAAGASPTAATAKLGWPTNMAFDVDGNLYFTDRYNHTVRRVAANGGAVTTVAGRPGVRCSVTTAVCGDGGLATAANLRSPWGIAVDGASPPTIYVSDYGDHRVRKIAPGTGIITTIAGTGTAGYNADGIPATTSRLNFPSGLTVDGAGDVLVADRGNHRIRKIDTTLGTISTFLGTGVPSGDAVSCSTVDVPTCGLNQPTDIEVRGSSTLPSVLSTTDFFIADRANDAVLVTRDGTSAGLGIIADRIGTGLPGYFNGITSDAAFRQPVSVAYDGLRDELYIADSNNLRVRRYSFIDQEVITVAGNGSGKLGDAGTYAAPVNNGTLGFIDPVNFPIGVAFLPSGDQSPGAAYFSGVYENQIRRLG